MLNVSQIWKCNSQQKNKTAVNNCSLNSCNNKKQFEATGVRFCHTHFAVQALSPTTFMPSVHLKRHLWSPVWQWWSDRSLLLRRNQEACGWLQTVCGTWGTLCWKTRAVAYSSLCLWLGKRYCLYFLINLRILPTFTATLAGGNTSCCPEAEKGCRQWAKNTQKNTDGVQQLVRVQHNMYQLLCVCVCIYIYIYIQYTTWWWARDMLETCRGWLTKWTKDKQCIKLVSLHGCFFHVYIAVFWVTTPCKLTLED